MDFAGRFEAWLGDWWYSYDARNNSPRIGRVLISRRRDACDVALPSAFGPNTLQRFKVWTDEVAVPKPRGVQSQCILVVASSATTRGVTSTCRRSDAFGFIRSGVAPR